MKRKIVTILMLVLIITAISATAVFANSNDKQEEKRAIKSMFDAMRSWSQQAQENGEITKEQAKELDNHFKDMEKYHKENGFAGHCGGSNSSSGDEKNQNFSSGMMGSFSGNSL